MSNSMPFSFPRRELACGLVRSFRAVSAPSPPMRGGWSADRRTHSFGRACDARPPCPGATGTSLGAPPWRFSDADPRSRLPAVGPEPQRLPAPGCKAWRSGSGPPALRFAPQRGTPLPAPPSGSSPETPLMSEDGDLDISTSICSQYINTHRSWKTTLQAMCCPARPRTAARQVTEADMLEVRDGPGAEIRPTISSHSTLTPAS